jgi:NitT/TauT family transport system permease protein
LFSFRVVYMADITKIFKTEQPAQRTSPWPTLIILFVLMCLVGLGLRVAFSAPAYVEGPVISLKPDALPWYALYSLLRMGAAYVLSVAFMFIYGYIAARNSRNERVMIPLLDVLQSVPILSFLPVVLLSLTVFLPASLATEAAAIVLIFTSQAWNLTFAFYQSLKTLPKELREVSSIFRFNTWQRIRTLDFPFFQISFIWNSMMSWSGGWFFLMAAEMFTVGQKDFRLPGLGSYLKEAVIMNDGVALFYGLVTLLVIIIALDQFIWRPLIAWSNRFKLEMVESEDPPTSWFYDLLIKIGILDLISRYILVPVNGWMDGLFSRIYAARLENHNPSTKRPWLLYVFIAVIGIAVTAGLVFAGELLFKVRPGDWSDIGLGLLFTLIRVVISLIIALAWTIPVGVAIGTNKRLANIFQPIVQIAASVPATALFPILVLFFMAMPGGLNMTAVFLMLMGTQWYLLFNIIAGSSTIPQDLRYTSKMLNLNFWQRWRVLILPSLFPFIITGLITASGGAWNASIVAEYVEFGGNHLSVNGIGAVIAAATADGDFPRLLASTVAMIVTVVLINRFFWRRLYRIAEDRFTLE